MVGLSALDVVTMPGAATHDLHRVLALEVDAGAERRVTFHAMAVAVCIANLGLSGDCGCHGKTCQADHQHEPCHHPSPWRTIRREQSMKDFTAKQQAFR